MDGTKSEMARLVKESGILGKAGDDLTAKNFDQKVSYDQIIMAIHKVQENMEITGTTAKEASETLQGSVAAAKASWSNFLSGTGDLGKVLDSVKTMVSNVIRIIKDAVPDMVENIVDWLPYIMEAGSELVLSLIRGITDYLPNITAQTEMIMQSLVD